jgi:oxygen-independent coproporphyrinogen-3 oxidase
MGQSFPLGKIAVYIHIPFCLSRCGYCSFYSEPYSRKALDAYVEDLKTELRLYEDCFFGGKVNARTLYFGGGTPSLLGPDMIMDLCARFDLAKDAEVTLEINPIQITAPYLEAVAKTPVNRLSIGLQSSRDEELAYLGRRHRFAGFNRKMDMCREMGFANISLDLIYGLPGSSARSLGPVLEDYIGLRAQHISTYLLSLDENCAWYRQQGEEVVNTLPDGDNAAAQYHLIRETLSQAGYRQYEISNFAREGLESHHNLCYWNSDPYLALGASACGWLPPHRYSNPADINAWKAMLSRAEIMPGREECDALQSERDYIMMRLRLLDGLDRQEFTRRFGKDFLLGREKAVEKMMSLGLIAIDDQTVRLTDDALFVSNAVIGDML